MSDYKFDSNNFLYEGIFNDEESDTLFGMNHNMDYSTKCFIENIPNIFNQKNDNNIFSYKDSFFSPNILNKDSSSQESNIQFPNILNEDSSKQPNSNNENNSSSKKEKSQLKEIKSQNNNSDNNNNNNQIIELDENSKNNDKNNIENADNKVLNKKRKPRVHLEDLGISNKKYQKIGDKVILSKYQEITENDKKEIKAERNRISAKKNRDKKKAEFKLLNKKIKSFNDELNIAKLIISNFEKICCSQCKLKLTEIKQKLLEDNDINNNENDNVNMGEESLVLEEKDSFFSDIKHSTIGKISVALFGLVALIGISLCLFNGLPISKNINNLNQKSISSNSPQIVLRHLTNNNICPNQNQNNVIIEKDNYVNDNKESHLPIPKESLNSLQKSHDKFTWEIYYNLKYKKEELKGNLLKKNNNENPILDHQICIELKKIENNNYKINNDSSLMNNIIIEVNNIIQNNKISNKITVVVKDYEALKKYKNGASLPLQEQIENEVKNWQDGCAYLQMFIPTKDINNNYDKNLTNSEFESENDFFEIRCKIFSYNKYYDQGVVSHYVKAKRINL